MKKFLFICIAIILFAVILPRAFGDLDEIWIYNVARNVAEGKILYKDISTIVTPILPICSALFLKLFGNQLITMRVLACLLNLGIFIITYLIFNKLKINKYFSILLIMFFVWIGKDYFTIDYNVFTMFMLLCIIYFELCFKENRTKKHEIIVGILAGICLCTKQTTGIFIVASLILYKLIYVHNKLEFKEFVKQTLYKILGILIPIIISIIYIGICGATADFISYCMFGIKEFSNKILYGNLFEGDFKILAILLPLIEIYFIISGFIARNKDTEYYKNIKNSVWLAISGTIVIYPISDNIHFLTGIYPIAIISVYAIYNLLKKIKLEEKYKIFFNYFIQSATIVLVIGITLINAIPTIYKYIQEDKSNLKSFNGIPIDKNLENDIIEVEEFIESQEKTVFILDAQAAIYQIPINKYNKNYDMFLKGNLGYKGEEKLISEIQNQDAIYLVKKPQITLNWQTPKSIINFVTENLKKTGEINIYEIYQK